MPAIGKSKVKRYSKTNTVKKSSKQSDTKGWFEWKRDGRGRKKVYTTLFKTRQPGIEAANVRKRGLSFDDAFKKHKSAGDKEFTWKGKKYHTGTKAELETGKSEKERFERAADAKKATPEKKGFFSKIATKLRGGHETQEAYETAKVARKKAKRIANLEARKAAGKSYSKKNLAALKGSTVLPKAKDFGSFVTKKKKQYSISS